MTTTAPTTATFSEQLCALLWLLSRGAPRDGRLDLRAQAGDAAITVTATSVLIADIQPRVIPTSVLTLLETSAWPWILRLAALDGHARLATLSTLVAEFRFEKVFRNPANPASEHGKQWVWPDPEIDETVKRVRVILPPTAVVDGRHGVFVLWALKDPLPAVTAAQQAHALDWLRRLTRAVGAVVPEDDARLVDLAVPLPGTVIWNSSGNPEVVDVLQLEPRRMYALDEIEAALTPADSRATTTPAPRRKK